jgi:hypothetical protein
MTSSMILLFTLTIYIFSNLKSLHEKNFSYFIVIKKHLYEVENCQYVEHDCVRVPKNLVSRFVLSNIYDYPSASGRVIPLTSKPKEYRRISEKNIY